MPIKKNKFSIKTLVVIVIAVIFLSAGLVNLFPPQTTQVFAQPGSVCLNRVDIPISDLHWVYVPESADELYTEERYFFLAGQLISFGIVDASDCPSGGLMLNGYANACGMSEAMPTVIAVQNLMNEPILQAYEDVGVPPVLLKLVMSTESQFWPSQHTTWHYGYGHITNLGIRNAIQWNPDLQAKVCPSGDCVNNISAADQILSSLLATCETCEYGIDLERAERSVDILAEVLLGYCFQSEQLVRNATGWNPGLATDYATIWKITLMNYNVGSQCVYDTLESTFEFTQGPMNWSDVSANVTGEGCIRGLTYANQITAPYFDFPPSE